jgi:hypothetical protein
MDCILRIALFICFTCGCSSAETNVLQVAKTVAQERYPGFTYGNSTKEKQVTCVVFLGAVAERLLGRPLQKDERRALYIDYAFDDLNKAVEEGDIRTKGVQRCFVDILGTARVVAPSDTKTGDFIQYWYLSKNGLWHGHASIVSRVWTDDKGGIRISLYGAHKTTNGIADADYGDGLLLDEKKKIFICRWVKL